MEQRAIDLKKQLQKIKRIRVISHMAIGLNKARLFHKKVTHGGGCGISQLLK